MFRAMHRRRLLVVALACALGPAAGHAASEKKRATETYIAFPTLTASLVRADGSRGVLSVEVGLDAPDPLLNRRAVGLTPRLLDAYARVMGVYAGSISPSGAPNPEVLGAQLQRATDTVLGRPGARVLFGQIIIN
jgi:hypothetical protein